MVLDFVLPLDTRQGDLIFIFLFSIKVVMIKVTDLATFIYCKRKFYLKNVLKIKPKITKEMVKGRIKHRVQELFFKNELEVLKRVKEPDVKEVKEVLLKNLKDVVEKALGESKKEIKFFDIDKELMKKQLTAMYSSFVFNRSAEVVELMKKKRLFGDALVSVMFPRFISEVKVSSNDLFLKGRIDLVEEKEDEMVPVELKTGNPPKQGIWTSDRIQLTAYALLARESFNKEVKLFLNPFMEYEIRTLVGKIKELLGSKKIPPVLDSRKCRFCSLREYCDSRKL